MRFPSKLPLPQDLERPRGAFSRVGPHPIILLKVASLYTNVTVLVVSYRRSFVHCSARRMECTRDNDYAIHTWKFTAFYLLTYLLTIKLDIRCT